MVVRAAEENVLVARETAVPWARPNVGQVRAVGLCGVIAALHRVVGQEAGEVSPAWRPLLLLALAEGTELA